MGGVTTDVAMRLCRHAGTSIGNGWYHGSTHYGGQSRMHGTAHAGRPRGPAVTVVYLLTNSGQSRSGVGRNGSRVCQGRLRHDSIICEIPLFASITFVYILVNLFGHLSSYGPESLLARTSRDPRLFLRMYRARAWQQRFRRSF